MTNVKVEVAVAVEVGEGSRSWPVSITIQSGPSRRVLEGAVTTVVVQGVGPPSGHEEVGMAVVVIVADRDAMAIPPRHAGDSRPVGDVLERAIPAVSEKPVSWWRRPGIGGKWPALHRVDVQPAVVVNVDEANSPTDRDWRDQTADDRAVLLDETES